MKRRPLGFLLVLALSAHAESFWDGTAAVQLGDAAFTSGLFAVSNAFARDTEIVVEDRATGKTTTARVVGRLDDRLDILVLLSPAAALPLGLEQGEIAFVRVKVKQPTPVETASILAEGAATSSDPDRLPPPAAGAAAAETARTSEPTEASAETAEASAEKAPAEAATPAEQIVASTEDSDFLAGLAARSPQKQLFLPPREDEMFAYQEPVEPPAEPPAQTVEVAEQPAETEAASVEAASAPQIASDAGPSAPQETAEPVALAEAQPPAETLPELVETLVATAPEPQTEPVRPLAEPEAVAAEAPTTAAVAKPVEAPAATVVEKPSAAGAHSAAGKPAEAAQPAAGEMPAVVLTALELPGAGAYTWYLQLAAYSTETLAKETAARLSPTYPALVIAPAAGSRPLYRVVIGPLNRAESGTLLAYFRQRGFPDAFVRTAQN